MSKTETQPASGTYWYNSQGKTAFHVLYDEAVNTFAAPYDIGEETRMGGARDTINILGEIAHSGNRLLDSAHSKVTLFESAEKIRQEAIGGYRRFLPGKIRISNIEEIDSLAELVPGVSHYQSSHPFRLDNPITGIGYGVALGLLGAGFMSEDASNVLEVLEKNTHLIALGAEIGTAAGLIGMLTLRNKFVKNRADFNNARIWDSTQFIDVIKYFADQGVESLAHIRGRGYPVPEYSTLPNKRFKANREKAIRNLRTNPLVARLGINIVE